MAYLYWMKDEPDRVRTVAPEHAAYWHDRERPGTSVGRLPIGRAA
jgi:hypothetical protein